MEKEVKVNIEKGNEIMEGKQLENEMEIERKIGILG